MTSDPDERQICCSFFTSWVIKRQKSCILNILKKHPTLGVWCTPLKYFSEFYKLFLGFYKSQFSGTTFVLVEKCLLLVYLVFKNSKNLMFIRVRCHKTINGAIYIWGKNGNYQYSLKGGGIFCRSESSY